MWIFLVCTHPCLLRGTQLLVHLLLHTHQTGNSLQASKVCALEFDAHLGEISGNHYAFSPGRSKQTQSWQHLLPSNMHPIPQNIPVKKLLQHCLPFLSSTCSNYTLKQHKLITQTSNIHNKCLWSYKSEVHWYPSQNFVAFSTIRNQLLLLMLTQCIHHSLFQSITLLCIWTKCLPNMLLLVTMARLK